MNPKYENLHYIDLGASLRKFNDVIKSRKQGDMDLAINLLWGGIEVILALDFGRESL